MASDKPLRLLLGFDYGTRQIGVAVGQAVTGQAFGRRLNGRFNLPVFTHDERLTTYAAKGERLAQGQRDGYRERPVDALAAALLLEGWLAEHPD
ncbi:Holliday junction resolvase RuvX [Pseudomonas aeruginosa]|uniref:Holliday junction resolvase RuvX n=1 Tax=Pseudomonas aeruginosa TaxID=287 RepID=UPI0010484A98|nr:Holliday junction resolvase RuvX [Pseudomonas aeruginosa]